MLETENCVKRGSILKYKSVLSTAVVNGFAGNTFSVTTQNNRTKMKEKKKFFFEDMSCFGLKAYWNEVKDLFLYKKTSSVHTGKKNHQKKFQANKVVDIGTHANYSLLTYDQHYCHQEKTIKKNYDNGLPRKKQKKNLKKTNK
ncbi:hypothetical protein RFI_12095 [Reticulomyxa filosa]|uniref:Uncharacterized protein n=1 Tax=Reticulomyxa filosa TaxID=46433 RepID=X6NI67_RETFI|nr:hypothetical protein RFI_12095 [Reticulomyxa filosa]|eukprot:ETO25047.1 hypothetical protein RFI_12095 [Reticulomyxa filosa]